jgi:MATE family multidrug resistance protein
MRVLQLLKRKRMHIESAKPAETSPKALFFLSLPLMLAVFSGNIMHICDRLLLAQFSLGALETCAVATALCILFQQPLLRIASSTQVVIGHHYGAGRYHLIGPCVWQMVWFSLASTLVTLPAGLFAAPLYFGGMSIEEPASAYFYCLLSANCLFPLGSALSCFYLGQGRAAPIYGASLISQSLNIGLNAALIFGVGDCIPSLGSLGSSLATIAAQATFCLILFAGFLSKKHRTTYRTGCYRLLKEPMRELLQIGWPRCLQRVCTLTVWAVVGHIMSLKGELPLLIFSLGGTLVMIFYFLNDGLMQGVITLASQLTGAGLSARITGLLRSSYACLSVNMALYALPFLVFPRETLALFVKDSAQVEQLIPLCGLLWVGFFCNGINLIGLGALTALRDTMYALITTTTLLCLGSLLPVWLAIEVFGWRAETLWVCDALYALVAGCLWVRRTHRLILPSIEKEATH